MMRSEKMKKKKKKKMIHFVKTLFGTSQYKRKLIA